MSSYGKITDIKEFYLRTCDFWRGEQLQGIDFSDVPLSDVKFRVRVL